MTTCKTCIYYDDIDDLKYYCDVHGVGVKSDLSPCRHYIPIDGAEVKETEVNHD